MPFKLSARQVNDVGRVGMQKARGIDVNFALVQAVDINDIAALNGTLSFRFQTVEKARHTDKHIVRIGAEIVGVISLFGVDRRASGFHFVGVFSHVIKKLLVIHTLKGEHHGRGHQLAVFAAAFVITAACKVCQVAVARAVNEKIGADRHFIALAKEKRTADTAVQNLNVMCFQMQKHVHARLTAHIDCEQFDRFRINVGHRIVLGAIAMAVGCTAFVKAVDKFFAEARNARLAVLVKEAEQRKSERHITAEKTVFLNEDHAFARARGCNGRGKARRSAAHNGDFIFICISIHRLSLAFFSQCIAARISSVSASMSIFAGSVASRSMRTPPHRKFVMPRLTNFSSNSSRVMV